MSIDVPVRRTSVGARRVGYAIAVIVNASLWYAANVWPGWREVPFLTEDTGRVLGWVNLSLIAGIVLNMIYLAYDEPWWRSTGELATSAIAIAVLVRVWQVFPFDFSGYSFDWAVVARVVLVVAIFGAAIGAIVQVGSLVRHAAR